MTITKRQNGGYLVSIGSRDKRFRRVCKTLEEAKAVEAAEEAVRAKQRLADIVGSTVITQKAIVPEVTLLDLWKRTKQIKWTSDSGVQAANAYRCIEILGPNNSVLNITQKVLNDLVETLYRQGNSGSTINRKLSSLSMMLKVAEEDGVLQHTFRMPRQREGQNRKRVFLPKEEQQMYRVCDKLGFETLKDYIAFTLDTGFRRSESLNIHSDDIQIMRIEGETVGMARLHDGETKSGKGRTVPLTPRALEIAIRRRGHGKIFFDYSAYLLRRQWEALRAAMRMSDDPGFVIHALRHTCLTRLGEAGKSAVFIQKWAGHSSIMVSQQYVHVGLDFLKSGVDALTNAAKFMDT